MRYGPLLFLGLLFALSLAWLGLVATPELQLGNQQPTNVPPAGVLYPIPHSGLANLGREVYRANGCAYCHTQVVRQEATRLNIIVSNAGTNEAGVVTALTELNPSLTAAQAQAMLGSLPTRVLSVEGKIAADRAQKTLSDAGAEVSVGVVPTGPDIKRGWGTRLTVAHDYLYEQPLLLGSTRLGPDLTNVGVRRPDAVWHLVHLYDPKREVVGSIMPRYPFLFERRKRGRQPSPDALPIAGDVDVIPTREAQALVAYLLSLTAEMPLFEAPAPPLPTPTPPAGGTNQPPGNVTDTNTPGPGLTGTNAPAPTNQPAAK